MSTLVTTLSPTDASQTEILARHLFNEERTAENADLDLEQYIQKLDGLHVGGCCLLNPANDREHAQCFDWLRLAIARNARRAANRVYPGRSGNLGAGSL
jgi:hypothetical protein